MAAQYIWQTWPDWLVKAVTEAYESGLGPEQIGAVLQRSPAVIRSKLVREGVYVSQKDKKKQLAEIHPEGF